MDRRRIATQQPRPEDVMEAIWREEALQGRKEKRRIAGQLALMQELSFWLVMGLVIATAAFLRAAGLM